MKNYKEPIKGDNDTVYQNSPTFLSYYSKRKQINLRVLHHTESLICELTNNCLRDQNSDFE